MLILVPEMTEEVQRITKEDEEGETQKHETPASSYLLGRFLRFGLKRYNVKGLIRPCSSNGGTVNPE